jgi:aspartyl-tRNA(Asn)/glutamyl-tRNA(Gln) amidotransferase subunit C
MISKEEVKKLADLARVEMSEPELEKLAKDLESILGYVSELKAAPVSDLSAEESDLINVFREDGNAYEPGTYTEDLVKAMSKSRNNYLSVKPILDKNK